MIVHVGRKGRQREREREKASESTSSYRVRMGKETHFPNNPDKLSFFLLQSQGDGEEV